MLSYHSDATLKARYLARVAGHAAADEIIKGRYWEGGKGCAVGCTIHGETHQDYERELGIPQMLAWLEDVIFEGLPNRLAKTWPERFLSAIQPGRELSPVGWRFLHWLLTGSRLGEFTHPSVRDAVERCADALRPLTEGRPVDVMAANDAAAAAWQAAKRAELAPAVPIGAAWSAESAARAAESAALTASSATASAEHAVTAASAGVAGAGATWRWATSCWALLEAA